MHPCDTVDLAVFEHPNFHASVELTVTPRQAFEVLEDADAWPQWLTSLRNVTWTSPDPKGVGTTRTVRMGGGIVAEEVFLAWDVERRMAFRFTKCSASAFVLFAEDYRLDPTSDGCRLTWSVVIEGNGVLGHVLPRLAPVMNRVLRRFLINLRRFTDARYSETTPGRHWPVCPKRNDGQDSG
ncbi:SRPBCC family protein [Mycobacterium sp. WUMAC-067]|nr:SRPBCC family protein [Mycobacterium sp. WUMAC-067]MCA2315985.1 SRPBCC family protein [Mycobacterium sp. WUMAC-025]